jgi:hypothetical protein
MSWHPLRTYLKNHIVATRLAFSALPPADSGWGCRPCDKFRLVHLQDNIPLIGGAPNEAESNQAIGAASVGCDHRSEIAGSEVRVSQHKS